MVHISSTSVKNAGKRIIGYPDDPVPTISTTDWFRQYLYFSPTHATVNYLRRLFPILGWISRYNLGWLIGDLIAGITVGIVLVPQSMSYAKIATLPSEYGLYSAFVGTAIYCLFATSKDVSIGPVAVMSLTVSQIISYVDSKQPNRWTGPEIATTVSLIAGFIVLGIGLLRLGRVVELIPAPAVSGFMTGSAINIMAGQVPGLMGITGFNTRAATFEVIINTLKGLPNTKLDAAFGLTALFFLYFIRWSCEYCSKRYPRKARVFFFISVLRNAFVLIVLTIASWLYTRHRKSSSGSYPIAILETVPSGLRHVGQPSIDSDLIATIGPKLPVATIILLLEHIAIAKSFGRVNGYKIDPNQELIAIGVTNTVGSCFSAYPATGSFSRSALKAKSGVRTPLAGIASSICVIVALYGLTSAFFWIPSAALSAVIIHAVADLVAKPPQVYSFWRVSPLEFVIWAAAVLVTVFSTIENGIYTSICASAALLLLRIAKPRGYFLGRVKLERDVTGSGGTQDEEPESREIFIPLKTNGILNPHVKVDPPKPGVVVYRFEESYVYPNCSVMNETIVDYAKAYTRRGRDMSGVKLSDRPWNNPGPLNAAAAAAELEAERNKPLLHAIVLDFSTVSHIDTTSVQALIDTRSELERWTDRPVEFHFATILSPWIRRALVAGGFGTGLPSASAPRENAPVVQYRDRYLDSSSLHDKHTQSLTPSDIEAGALDKSRKTSAGFVDEREEEKTSLLLPAATPFFHFDLHTAVKAAELGLEKAKAASVASTRSSSRRRDTGGVKEADVKEPTPAV